MTSSPSRAPHDATPGRARRPPDSTLERATSIGLRTVHLVAVVALGGVVLGAALPARPVAAAVAATGLALLVLDLRAGRIRLDELAGAVVLAKLAAVLLAAAWPPATAAVFWSLVVASSLSSHAPKPVRHAPLRRAPRSSR